MADTLKVLGQSAPAATTLTTLYTVPGATTAVVSSLFITNRAGTAGTFRVAVRVAGAAIANQQYLYYDTAIPANETLLVCAGLSLAATDVVSVYASSADQTFNLFGVERT